MVEMNWVLPSIAILTLIIVLLIYFYPTLFNKSTTIGFIGPVNLSTATTIFNTESVKSFEQNNYGTLQGFLNIVPLHRTPTAFTCGTTGNPSCDTGRFDNCTCVDTTCSNCTRNGYYPILQIGDTLSLEILPAPDAGRPGQAMAQLAITTHALSLKTIEILNLPPIPTQKWVMISIVKEGRRFSIYYNNALVLSQKTQYYVASSVARNGIICGNPVFNGSAANFNLTQTAMVGMEIATAYTKYSDTRGVPYVTMKTDKTLDFTIPSLCPSGGCLQTPTIRPAQPYLEWDTSYA